MQEQPEPTSEEEEQAPEDQEEHEAMRGPGYEDPPEGGDSRRVSPAAQRPVREADQRKPARSDRVPRLG